MRRSGHPGVPQVPAVRGRPFADGNSGRKPGSKNRGTIIAAALLEGDAEALLRKAIEVALSGDVPMLRFLLGRILPRDRVIKIGLPQMEFADDGVKALGYVMHAVSDGTITPSEGAELATIVKSYTDAIDTADLVKRFEALESKIMGPAR
jgi:hypothetical protein